MDELRLENGVGQILVLRSAGREDAVLTLGGDGRIIGMQGLQRIAAWCTARVAEVRGEVKPEPNPCRCLLEPDTEHIKAHAADGPRCIKCGISTLGWSSGGRCIRCCPPVPVTEPWSIPADIGPRLAKVEADLDWGMTQHTRALTGLTDGYENVTAIVAGLRSEVRNLAQQITAMQR